MGTKSVDELAAEATAIIKRYLKNPRTDFLRELAPVIVDLRAHFTLEDGRPDWSGRSPGYRQVMIGIYEKTRLSGDDLDRFQSALRYHVGNLLRERASKDELISVGLTTVAPKERVQSTRDALHAMKEAAAPRQDLARLAAYAQALLEYADEAAIPDIDPERAEASRLALEAVQQRASELFVRLRDAREAAPAGPRGGGRARRSGLRSV